jgi:LPS sulfotransferase NodH
MLGQHPAIYYDGETYGRHLHQVRKRLGTQAWASTDLIDGLAKEMHTAGPGWFGFDYLPNYLRWTGMEAPDHARALRELGFTHFVLLTRRNYVKQMVSMRAAMGTRLWHDRGQATGRITGRVRVPVEGEPGAIGLIERIARIEEFYEMTRHTHAGDRFLELCYEDHIESDPREGYRRVVDFLDLEPYEPAVRLRRLSTSTVRDRLENVDEVAEALRGTRYEWMLEA